MVKETKMDYSGYINELRQHSIVQIPCDSFDDEALIDIASNIGCVITGSRGELVQRLPAREKGEGPVGSFSYVVGYGRFPWHVDTAYWNIPTHYLLLASDSPSSCATLYQDFLYIKSKIHDFEYLAKRAVFLLNVPGKKRYLSPLFEVNGRIGFRMDFHVYLAANAEAELLQEKVMEILEHDYRRHVWTGKEVVVMDNWRMIHAREDASDDTNRILKRIYINELV